MVVHGNLFSLVVPELRHVTLHTHTHTHAHHIGDDYMTNALDGLISAYIVIFMNLNLNCINASRCSDFAISEASYIRRTVFFFFDFVVRKHAAATTITY